MSNGELQHPNLISAPEAAKRLGLKYHAFIQWIRANRFQMRDHAHKIGHSWVVDAAHVDNLVQVVKERANAT